MFQLTTFENALFGNSKLNSLFDAEFREVLEYLGDLKHYYKDCYYIDPKRTCKHDKNNIKSYSFSNCVKNPNSDVGGLSVISLFQPIRGRARPGGLLAGRTRSKY